MVSFSEKLRGLIEERGISQRWLADEANTTEATISRYINGVHQPNVNLIIDIAKALDVSVDYLLDLTSMPHAKEDKNEELRLLVKSYNRASNRDKKILWGFMEDYLTDDDKAVLSLLHENDGEQKTNSAG